VRITGECGQYEGARPYFAVVRFQKKGTKPEQSRHTPSREWADVLFALLADDVTDPTTLAGY
jgi:hypothetical protein